MNSHGRALESRDLALALLASRLCQVSEQVGGLAARVEAAEVAIGRQTSLVAETADLAREVSRLPAAMARQDSPAAGWPGNRTPASAGLGGHEPRRVR
jgi:hypothetical protein